MARARGERIRVLRERHGLSQEQLAKRAGTTPSKICAIERGRNKATSGDTQEELARGFGLTIEQVRAVLDGSLSIEDAYDMRDYEHQE